MMNIDDFKIKNGVLESYKWKASEIIIPEDFLLDEKTTIYQGFPSITIPEGVSIIGNHAFECSAGLKEITLPDSVTCIKDYAFKDCFFLTTISLSDHLTSIGNYAFQNCHSLRSVKIPASVKFIGKDAFCEDCTLIM